MKTADNLRLLPDGRCFISFVGTASKKETAGTEEDQSTHSSEDWDQNGQEILLLLVGQALYTNIAIFTMVFVRASVAI